MRAAPRDPRDTLDYEMRPMGEYGPVRQPGGRMTGGAGFWSMGESSADGWMASPAVKILGGLLLVAVVVGAALGIAGFAISLDNRGNVDDNDDRLDDIEDLFDADKREGTFLEDISFNEEVQFKKGISVGGVISGDSFAICPEYPVCTSGAVTEGYAVSLTDGCVTDGFEPHPNFVFDTVTGPTPAASYYDLGTKSVSLGGNSLVHIESDFDNATTLRAYSTWYSNGAYSVLSAQVGVGGADGYALATNGDGATTYIVRGTDVNATDVMLYRCSSTATTFTCDSGVVLFPAASSAVAVELLHVSSVNDVDVFVLLYLTDNGLGDGQPATVAFTARAVADQAIVGIEAAPTVIPSPPLTFSGIIGDMRDISVHLVDMQGPFSANMYGVVYGGYATLVPEVSLRVYTLGVAPNVSAPAQTNIAGGPHVFLDRTDSVPDDDDVVQVQAASLPGTNNVVVKVTEGRQDPFSTFYVAIKTTLFSVKVETNAAQSVVVYTTGANSGMIGTSPTPYVEDIGFEARDLQCLNPTTCVLAQRVIAGDVGAATVELLEVNAGSAALVALGDQARFWSTDKVEFEVVPTGSALGFAIVYKTQTVGSVGSVQRVALAALNNAQHPARSQIQFALSTKGQHPLGIAREACIAGADCNICVAGVATVPETSALSGLTHVNAVYAYPSGQLGLGPSGGGDISVPSSQIGVHVGGNRVLVRPTGQFD
jgi:hypothetical protein